MLRAKLILERLDKEGRLLERREQRSKSFTKGFIQLLYVTHAYINSTSPYSMTDIDGNPRDIDARSALHYTKGNLKIGSCGGMGAVVIPTFSTTFSYEAEKITLPGDKIGIQVGTGTNAVIPTDTALQTRIAHGRVATQLEYGGCEFIGIVFVNPNGEFTIRRYFTNASGGLITVEEVGIYAGGTKHKSPIGAWPFLIARDLTGGVAVADGEILRATYVPQTTV